ncbi:MAG: L,D-transpeptidase family protein [Syntrophaceae bacterium]|nr:L,D-transpeptidase family protein [Syntrophaceae bacterium]
MKIIRFSVAFIVALGLAIFLFGGSANAQSLPDLVRPALKARFEGLANAAPPLCRAETPCRSSRLADFYRQRAFGPAWVLRNGPSPQADRLLSVLWTAGQYGLSPTDYHYEAIRSLLAAWRISGKWTPGEGADFDLLCTDAFMLFGSHLLSGVADPNGLFKMWEARPRFVDWSAYLQDALAAQTVDVHLQVLKPDYPGYDRLVAVAAEYAKIAVAGGWPVLPPGKSLKKGVSDPRVPILRKRLIAGGDLAPAMASEDPRFDDVLDQAVRKFQRRHGLTEDGAVQKETLKALNVPVERRVVQMLLNLERWRWLPQEVGNRFLFINIPDFSLTAIENGRAPLSMRVVVGMRHSRDPKIEYRTPAFTGRMTYLEINPYWNVPFNIAIKEYLPKLQKDPVSLQKQGMKIILGRDTVVDPKTVDWAKMNEKTFKYRIRQDPGAFNALSHIKFMFPNRFDVYLHDTPQRSLFKRTTRDFSHGCMRVEKPIDLAVYLLQDDVNWSREKILAAIRKGKNQAVDLPAPITVHIAYWTAWVDPDGTVQFRDDIYRYDSVLEAVMGTKTSILAAWNGGRQTSAASLKGGRREKKQNQLGTRREVNPTWMRSVTN